MDIWIGKYILIQIWNIYWHQILLKVYFWSVQMLIKFHTIFQIFILGSFFPKYREKKCCFLNNIFHKFEIVVFFAPLLHGFDRNTQFSIPWNLKIALHGGSEENKEKWDEPFSRARATRKKQGQRAPLPLQRNSDGKSFLDFLTFIIYRRAKYTFCATRAEGAFISPLWWILM